MDQDETGTAALSAGDKKRSLVPQETTTTTAAAVAISSAAAVTPAEAAPPPYGSKQYWEDRYAKLQQKNESNKPSSDADPFHAWYFNFEELAPLILPLILGAGETEEGEGQEESENDKEEKKVESTEDTVEKEDADAKPASDSLQPSPPPPQQALDDGSDRSDDFEEESDDEDEEDDSPSKRVGLAENGPISVVEIGCGDVPLGRDLVTSILDMEAQIDVDASNILEKVVCLDYSQNVIDAMREAQKEQEQQCVKKAKRSTVPLIYQVADARKLPYDDESFEMLLEKGTLDAMLSDRDGNGSKNCHKIVAECARVLKRGGCMVVISHLNAHVSTGLQWLNDVIMPGLQMGAGDFDWSIEVHGNEADIPSEDESADDCDTIPESPGPAVYILRKGDPFPEELMAKYAKDPPIIRLKFFTY